MEGGIDWARVDRFSIFALADAGFMDFWTIHFYGGVVAYALPTFFKDPS